MRSDALVGTGPQVAERLRALAARLQIEEMVINTWTFDPEARRRSYTLLAQVFGLDGAPP
jgi:alkanesulfonate monooxygenase SsuD/methylene tetrahydromethanopterin reductase-like flavin-dependent oxidoreductase (luciferase family)